MSHKRWTKEEEEFLKENYLNLSYKEIADHLDRNLSSVEHKINRMGLIKNQQSPHRKWTEEEEIFLRENYLNLSHEEIAKYLNRKVSSVSHKLSRMKLNKVSYENHSLTNHPLYDVWSHMKVSSRKLNFELPDYWCSLIEFYNWAIENGWKEGLRFCRKDETLPFSKENCEFISKSKMIKRNRPKTKKTWLKKYGVEYAVQSEEIKEKIKRTNRKRYGSDWFVQTKEFKEKNKKTNLEKRGVEYLVQSEEFKRKSRETCIEKYGKPFAPFAQPSKEETSLKDWLNSIGFEFISNHDILDGKEIDLYNEELKLAVEYCGLYWHCEDSKSPRLKNYHFDKYKDCLEQGVQLITIFSDEWIERQEQIKGFLKSRLNKNEIKIHGRKCEVEEIDSGIAKEFVTKYHIQELKRTPIISFGLIYNQELVGVITLNRHHRDNTKLILERLAFKENISVNGGSHKLFKRCIEFAKQNGYSKITTWSDNRWTQGNIYYQLGFELDKELGPDYSYVNLLGDATKRYPKQSMKKSNIGCPKEITEKEFLRQRGFSRIWDCGKKRFVFKLINR